MKPRKKKVKKPPAKKLQRAQWKQGRLPKDVMDAVKKGIPKDARNLAIQKKGNKYRVLFERGGKKFQIFPWEVRGTGYNINPTGVVGQHQGRPVINVNPTISPHIEVRPNIIIRGNEGYGGEGHERRREIRPEPRPVEERPLFDFDAITRQLNAEVQQTFNEHGLVLGIKKPKREKKFKRKPIFVGTKDIQGKTWKKILANKWLPEHPIKLAGEIVSTKKGGWLKFRRDKKNAKKIEKLNTKYAPEVEAMTNEYELEARTALLELMESFNTGRINKRNRNEYFKNYQKQIRDAQTKFKHRANEVIQSFRKEFTGKWV